jgi:hypothetical protein
MTKELSTLREEVIKVTELVTCPNCGSAQLDNAPLPNSPLDFKCENCGEIFTDAPLKRFVNFKDYKKAIQKARDEKDKQIAELQNELNQAFGWACYWSDVSIELTAEVGKLKADFGHKTSGLLLKSAISDIFGLHSVPNEVNSNYELLKFAKQKALAAEREKQECCICGKYTVCNEVEIGAGVHFRCCSRDCLKKLFQWENDVRPAASQLLSCAQHDLKLVTEVGKLKEELLYWQNRTAVPARDEIKRLKAENEKLEKKCDFLASASHIHHLASNCKNCQNVVNMRVNDANNNLLDEIDKIFIANKPYIILDDATEDLNVIKFKELHNQFQKLRRTAGKEDV